MNFQIHHHIVFPHPANDNYWLKRLADGQASPEPLLENGLPVKLWSALMRIFRAWGWG